MRARWTFLLLPLLAAGCELTEVGTAPAEDVLVVEAVLQAERFRQAVLLHRSLDGRRVRGETGARVRVVGPRGEEFRFSETPLTSCADGLNPEATDSLEVAATCYTTAGRVLIEPGSTYELYVSTAGGEEVRGRTTVPAAFRLAGPSLAGSTCVIPPRTNLPIAWSVSQGAWSYLATMDVIGLGTAIKELGIRAPDRVELTGLAISETDTTLVIPSQFGLFELNRLDNDLIEYLQGGFPQGVTVRIAVSALDRNYVNAIRGGRFNPSGAVRISSVVGDGVGVFGSLFTQSFSIEVAQRSPLIPCSRLITGTR